jgi:hypothetical protein
MRLARGQPPRAGPLGRPSFEQRQNPILPLLAANNVARALRHTLNRTPLLCHEKPVEGGPGGASCGRMVIPGGRHKGQVENHGIRLALVESPARPDDRWRALRLGERTARVLVQGFAASFGDLGAVPRRQATFNLPAGYQPEGLRQRLHRFAHRAPTARRVRRRQAPQGTTWLGKSGQFELGITQPKSPAKPRHTSWGIHLLGARTLRRGTGPCRLCRRRIPRWGKPVGAEECGARGRERLPVPRTGPSDAWRSVDAGSPLPRVGHHRTVASGPGTGSPAGAAFRVGPGDQELYEQRRHHRTAVAEYLAGDYGTGCPIDSGAYGV